MDASCGDGFVHADEEACDDGNLDDQDDCPSTCEIASCGDGFVHIGEEACDDGNDDDNDACLSDCVRATCGDGILYLGVEECDDGNDSNNDDCLRTCTAARCGDRYRHAELEACDDGNDDNTDGCIDTCERASCGDGHVRAGFEACDDGNDDNTDACLDGCEPAACGDGYLHEGVEMCDEGNDNGLDLGGCNEACENNWRYERILSIDAAGQVTFGNWNEAVLRVYNAASDCLLRFDDRLAEPLYTEHIGDSLRFDFHPLHAWHNSWDAYAFIELEPGRRAGIGANYRRGHPSNVWQRSNDQHSEAEWHAMPVDLYCERETAYEQVATYVDGEAVEGSWEALFEAVVERAAICKVRFDGRIAPVPHVEYGDGWMNLDFLGLNAQYNSWDAYAYAKIDDGRRSGIGANYRRGTTGSIQQYDQTQHAESQWQDMQIEVFCADLLGQEFQIDQGGQMIVGEWDDFYTTIVSEARVCKVVYDQRVSEIPLIEASAEYYEFDFMNLNAYHNSWDSFALVDVAPDQAAGLRDCYRRGDWNTIWKQTATQHGVSARNAMPLRIRCEDQRSYQHVLTMQSNGLPSTGDWDSFYEAMLDPEGAYECKIRLSDGRITNPLQLEYSDEGKLYFDYLGLSGYHNGHDAYATTILQSGGSVGIAGTYRRGHDDNIWRLGVQQHSRSAIHQYTVQMFCR